MKMDTEARAEIIRRTELRVIELEAISLEKRRNKDRNELALRAALLCLIHSRPLKTDGALTNENLIIESGVARATVYRNTEIMADWKTLIETMPGSSTPSLREQIRDLKAENRQLHAQISEERRQFQSVQDILVQRLQALTLALTEVQDGSKVMSVGELRRKRRFVQDEYDAKSRSSEKKN